MPRPAKPPGTPAGPAPKPPSSRGKTPPRPDMSALSDALIQALSAAGGADYLVAIARDDPKTFLALLTKVLPAPESVSSSDKDVTLAWQSPENPPPAG